MVIKAIDTPEEATEWANAVCVRHGVPFINGGFLDDIGVIGPVYIPGESLCAACLGFGNARRVHGIGPTFAPLTMMVGSTLSMFVFLLLTGRTAAIRNKLHLFNTRTAAWDVVNLRATERCPVCGNNPHEDESTVVGNRQRIRAYRGGMTALFMLSAVLRFVAGDAFVGLPVFFALVLSYFHIESWFADNPAEMRREIFVTSFLYCAVSLVANAIFNFGIIANATGRGLSLLFGVVQDFSMTVLEIGVAVSVLFFVSIAVVYGIKQLSGKGESWLG